MKTLTVRQKTIQAQRQVKKYLKAQLEPKLMKSILESLKMDDMPLELMEENDQRLAKHILRTMMDQLSKKEITFN